MNNNDYSGRFSTAANQQYNIDVNGVDVTFSTALTSSGGSLYLTSTTSGGVLTLNAAETYTGGTVVGSGTLDPCTLALGASGSISGSHLSINAGSTFDVTLADPYTLTVPLYADGIAGSASSFNDSGPMGISLGAEPVYLTFTPANPNGDTANPPLTIPAGALTLVGNAITVNNNVPGIPLGAGTYLLINVVGGSLTTNGSETVTVTGSGLAAGASAALAVSGGSLNMVVSGGQPEPLFSNLAASPSVPYGSATITLTGTVSYPVGPTYPAMGETFPVTIGAGSAQNATVYDMNGDFTITYNLSSTTLAAGTTYTITYAYTGDAGLNVVTNTATKLTITKAPVTVTATALSVPYGTAAPYTGSADFTAAFSNSETIATVTLTGSTDLGTYEGTNTPAAVSSYDITPSAAAGGTANLNNYTITYAPLANGLTVTPVALTITASAESYTYGTAYTGLGTLKTTNFTGTGFKNGQTVALVTVTLACTTNANAGTATAPVAGSPYGITPSAAAELGTATNFNPANYTIAYATGNLTENPLAVKLTGSQPYNGATWIEANSLTVSNIVPGDTVYVAQGLAFTAAAEPAGVFAIASFGTLVLGNAGGQGSLPLGSTPATDLFNAPASMAVDTSGNLYVADTANNRVCEITQAGVQTVVPFIGLINPVGVAVDVNSNIYVVCPNPAAVIQMPAAGGPQVPLLFNGLSYPTGVAVDANGDLFLSDTLNNRVLEMTAPVTGTSVQAPVANLYVALPAGLCVDTNGDIFVVNSGSNNVVELPSGGTEKILSTFTGFSFPAALAVDNYTNVYLASYASTNIRVLSLGIATPAQTTDFNGLSECEGVAVDASGNLFAVDSVHNRIAELPNIGANGAAPLTYGTVTYFGTTVANNYTMTGASGNITNVAIPLTITANPVSKTYGQAIILVSNQTAFAVSSGPLVAGQSVTNVTMTASGGTAANAAVSGSPYTITPSAATGSGGFVAGGYTITYNTGLLTVNPAPATVTANPQTLTYGTLVTLTPVTGSTAFTASTLSNSETMQTVTLTFSTTNVTASGTITPSAATGGTFNPTNYNITYDTGVLTVTPVGVTLTGTRAYDGTANAASSILTASGVLSFDVGYVTVVNGPGTLASSWVGTQNITALGSLALGGPAGGNYALPALPPFGSVIVTNPFYAISNTASLDITGTNFVVCWTSVPGVNYTVLTNSSLNPPQTWSSVGSVSATSTTTCFTLPGGIVGNTNVNVVVQQ